MGSLSGITSLLSPILTMSSIPGAAIGIGTQLIGQQQARDQLRAQQNIALAQLKARQNLDESATEQDASLQKAKIQADALAAEERRKTALRRAVARQKTLFSAQGMGGLDGSNEAVLLGLYNDSQEDAAAQTQADALRQAAIDQNLNQLKQKNLLQATQFAESQNLARILQDN